MEAFHGPRSSGRESAQTKGSQSRLTSAATGRKGFMVLLHAPERKETLHEPQRRAGILPACVGNADETQPLPAARSPGQAGSLPHVEIWLPKRPQSRMIRS